MSEAAPQEQYEATVVQVGNSRGMRLPAGFFNAHPEFNGKVRVTVVGEGQVLVSAKPPSVRRAKNDEADPVLLGLLEFLQQQMTKRPQDTVVADADQLRRIGKLVKGVALN